MCLREGDTLCVSGVNGAQLEHTHRLSDANRFPFGTLLSFKTLTDVNVQLAVYSR